MRLGFSFITHIWNPQSRGLMPNLTGGVVLDTSCLSGCFSMAPDVAVRVH